MTLVALLLVTNLKHHHLFLFWWLARRSIPLLRPAPHPAKLLFIVSAQTFISVKAATKGAAICFIMFEISFPICKCNFAAHRKLCINAGLL